MDSTNGDNLRHILMVEDNVADAKIASIIHDEVAHCSQLDVVHNGIDALRYLRGEDEFAEKRKPDVILLDMTLPMKSGLEMIGDIRSVSGCKAVPIVIVSGSENPVSLAEAYELGANCVIAKSSNWQEYFDKLETCYKFWCKVAELPSRNVRTL
jgi:CheY-like chemotaxis protein